MPSHGVKTPTPNPGYGLHYCNCEENNPYESEGVGGRASSPSKKVKYSNNKTPYMDRGK
jgi:hypothetical protein